MNIKSLFSKSLNDNNKGYLSITNGRYRIRLFNDETDSNPQGPNGGDCNNDGNCVSSINGKDCVNAWYCAGSTNGGNKDAQKCHNGTSANCHCQPSVLNTSITPKANM